MHQLTGMIEGNIRERVKAELVAEVHEVFKPIRKFFDENALTDGCISIAGSSRIHVGLLITYLSDHLTENAIEYRLKDEINTFVERVYSIGKKKAVQP